MSRKLPAAAAEIGRALVGSAGGYLRNTVHEPLVTCSLCSTPVDGYQRCYQCYSHLQSSLTTAERVATVVYAQEQSSSGSRDQTYLAMYGYKADRPQNAHIDLVRSLLALAVIGHTDCDLKLTDGAPSFRWTTVPSTRNPTREHPLHALVSSLFHPGFELRLHTRQGAVKGRTLQPANYEVLDPVPIGTHVVVIDDSWVSGGSAQSVAIATRTAGAQSVSILAVARVLSPDYSTGSVGIFEVRECCGSAP